MKLGKPIKHMINTKLWCIRQSIWEQAGEKLNTKTIWVFINDEVHDKVTNLIQPNAKDDIR